MSDEPPKERIWPVFMLASAVVLLGTWLAFASTPRPVESTPADDPFITPLPEPSVLPGEAVEFTPVMSARTLNVDLRQERRSEAHTVQTRIAFTLRDTARAGSGEERVWERSYHDVDIATYSDGEPFGVDVAHEVERLLATARIEVTGRPTAEVTGTRVVSAEAAQLRQLLSMIRQAVDIAEPRLPREAVRPLETWQWMRPVDVLGPEESVVKATGKMEVSARVVGNAGEHVIVAFDLTGEIGLDISLPQDSAEASTAQKGSGRGIAVWDLERGLMTSDVLWEQTAEQVSTIVRVKISRPTSTE